MGEIDLLVTVWTQLLRFVAVSSEIASAIVKCLWTWSQRMVNHAGYSDHVNPVCFPEQIAPLMPLLQTLPSEELVQLVNLLASLLKPVQPCDANREFLTQVCQEIVHVLDLAGNAENPEVIGNILDFMMTMYVVEFR